MSFILGIPRCNETADIFDEAEQVWFQSRLVANEQRYIDKWGGLPGAERFEVPFDGPIGADDA